MPQNDRGHPALQKETSDEMSRENLVRLEVSRAYAKAVSGDVGCCAPAGEPKGTAAKLAGYSACDTGTLPSDAVENSFGCGNPIAFGGVREGDVVLDLGSGAGLDLLLAAKKTGPSGKVIGVDMTDEMIDRARKNIAAAGLPNVEVRKGIIEDLPVESGSVDWVISNCVINLSPEKPRVFAEIARVLKPGGALLVSDIVASGLPDWVLENAALHSSCVAGAISEEAYLAAMRSAGLDQAEVRSRLVYSADQVCGLAESEIRDSLGLSGVDAAPILARVKAELGGKIASVTVFAKKPGGGKTE